MFGGRCRGEKCVQEDAGSLGPVSVTAELAAPRAEVWTYLEHEGRRARWLPSTQIELKPGGAVSSQRMGAALETLIGNVDVFVPGHAVGIAWSPAQDSFGTSVLITLHSLDDRTKVSVHELGFEPHDNAAARAQGSFSFWSSALRALQELVEKS